MDFAQGSSQMIAAVDALALAFLLLELAHLSLSSLALKPVILDTLYRWADRLLNYRLQQLAWLAFDYLAVRLAWVVWQSEAFSFWQAVAASGGLLLLCAALFYPLSFAWGVLITPWCSGRSMGHNLTRCLPEHAVLSAAWQTLRKEYQAAIVQFGKLPSINDILSDIDLVTVAAGQTTATTDTTAATRPARWTTLFLRLGGRDFSATMRHFPVLSRALDSQRIVGALYSCLEPGVELKPHRGYFKGFLRYHLCLDVQDSDKVWLVVDGQRYHWQSGEAIVFDDSYVHSAHNLSNHPRVVLFLDVLRPLPVVLHHINRAIALYAAFHPFSAVIERNVNHWANNADAHA